MKTMKNVGTMERESNRGLYQLPGVLVQRGNCGKGLSFDEFGPQPQGGTCDLHQFFKRCTFTGADRHTL